MGSFFEVEIVMSCEINVGFESGSYLLDEVNNLSTQCSNEISFDWNVVHQVIFKRDIIYFPIFLEKRYVKGGFCLI